jgi:hypothetical protein
VNLKRNFYFFEKAKEVFGVAIFEKVKEVIFGTAFFEKGVFLV